jgi:hypothetical protein
MQRALIKPLQVVRSSDAAMASTSPGWQVQPRVYAVVHQGTAGSPASQRSFAAAAHVRQAILLSRHKGRSVVQ